MKNLLIQKCTYYTNILTISCFTYLRSQKAYTENRNSTNKCSNFFSLSGMKRGRFAQPFPSTLPCRVGRIPTSDGARFHSCSAFQPALLSAPSLPRDPNSVFPDTHATETADSMVYVALFMRVRVRELNAILSKTILRNSELCPFLASVTVRRSFRSLSRELPRP